MNDLVNTRLQKHKKHWYKTPYYPKIILSITLFLIGITGVFSTAVLWDAKAKTDTYSMFLMTCAIIASIITGTGAIMFIDTVDKINRNYHTIINKKYTNDSLYDIVSSYMKNGYFTPFSLQSSLLYLMVNRLLQYDLEFEFKKTENILPDKYNPHRYSRIITGISKKHQTQVTLRASIKKIPNNNHLYKNIELTLTETDNN